jgi:hypothetical protein
MAGLLTTPSTLTAAVAVAVAILFFFFFFFFFFFSSSALSLISFRLRWGPSSAVGRAGRRGLLLHIVYLFSSLLFSALLCFIFSFLVLLTAALFDGS